MYPPLSLPPPLPAGWAAVLQQAAGSGAHVTLNVYVNNYYGGGPPH